MSGAGLSLKARLWLLGVASCLGLLLLAAVSLWSEQRGKAYLVEFIEQDIALNRHASGSYASGLQLGQAMRNILLDPANPKGHDNHANAAAKFSEEAALLVALLRRNPDDARLAADLEARIAAWRPLQSKVIELVKAGKGAEAAAAVNAAETPAWRAVRELLLELVKRSEAGAEAKQAALLDALDASGSMAIAVSLVTFVLVVSATVLVGRGVFRQVGAEPAFTAEVLHRIAQGDLSQAIPLANADRHSILAAADGMQAQLRNLMGQISGGSRSVLQASENLGRNADGLSASAEEQSNATSAIAAAVEELTVSIGVMSENAAHAASLSSDTEGKVRDGLRGIGATTDSINKVAESMTQSSVTMEELSGKVNSINGIARTIREIADQTNLLALNAAIEAARAGEQGRGFAVVADEVRKLAERTTASTLEISETIAGVQGSAQAALATLSQTRDLALAGARHTNEVQSAVSGLDQAAGSVRDAVEAIKAALKEQSAASTDIAQRVERIARGIEDTHRSAASSSGHSRELVGLARMLQEQVSRFRT